MYTHQYKFTCFHNKTTDIDKLFIEKQYYLSLNAPGSLIFVVKNTRMLIGY